MIGLIIFSRMDSRRLPGKALRPIGDRPLLGRVLDRARLASSPDRIVVATTERDIDDPIARFASDQDVTVFRGATDDVAGRALACAEALGFEHFARISGDSPFFDPAMVHRLMELTLENDLDLATNVFPRSFPVGASVEIIASRALCRLVEATTDPQDREHVTRYFYDHANQFQIENVGAGDDRYQGVSVGVDEPDDLARAVWMAENLSKPIEAATLDEVVAVARAWHQPNCRVAPPTDRSPRQVQETR
jgi:spore coat polysaccharide biosynthesis protein SpsF